MPIGFEVKDRNNGRVVTLECSAGKRCVLASAPRFVWRSNPSGPTTFVGCDEMEELTQKQIRASKKEMKQLLVSQQESVRGPSSGWWNYNISSISEIGTSWGLDIGLSLRTCSAFHQSELLRLTGGSAAVADANVDMRGGCSRNNSIHASRGRCFYQSSNWTRPEPSPSRILLEQHIYAE